MLINNNEYNNALPQAIERIKTAQYTALVNTNLTLLHRNWKLGEIIREKSEWGNKFVSSLAADIKMNFRARQVFLQETCNT